MIVKRLISAWRGRAVWIRLRKRWDIDDGAYVVAMIENDHVLNSVALAHLDDLVDDRRARGVVIVTGHPEVAEQASASSRAVLAVEILAADEIEDLISFYELYQFTPRIFFVSLTRPYPNHLSRMIGVCGLSLDDLVCLSMFRIRGWNSEAVTHS